MASAAAEVLNRRELGSTIAAWAYDPATDVFTVEMRLDAVRFGSGPLATAALLASNHVRKVGAAERNATDRTMNAFVASVTREAVSWLSVQLNTWLRTQAKVTLTAKNVPGDNATAEGLLQYLANEAVRIHMSGLTPTQEVARVALTTYGTGRQAPETNTGALWKPMMRLAHANVDVDPDNVPRYEREIHHADARGRLEELRELLALVAAALAGGGGSRLWEAVSAGLADADGMFEAAASSTVPFGPLRPDSVAVKLLCDNVHAMIADAETKEPGLVVTASFEAEPMLMAPTIDFGEGGGGYACGCSTFAFAEAVVIAAHALERAAEQPYTDDDAALFGPEKARLEDALLRPVSATNAKLVALERDVAKLDTMMGQRRSASAVGLMTTFATVCPTFGNNVTEETLGPSVTEARKAFHLRKAGLSAVGKELYRGFRGWHHARCLEPRQTAHATLVGADKARVLTYFAVDGDNPGYLVGTLMHTVLHTLVDLDAPKVAGHAVVYVKGPGTTAVSTPCAIEQMLVALSALAVLECELDRSLFNAIEDMERVVPPGTLAAAVRGGKAVGGLRGLLRLGVRPNLVARVARELHTYANVRHDAGKRYRHAVGVNASFSALTDSLKQVARTRLDARVAERAAAELPRAEYEV
jgi:hypothetical protein